MDTNELIAVLEERKETIARFKKGDVLYRITNGKYNVYKILFINEVGYHIKSFVPQNTVPSSDSLPELETHNPHLTIKNLKGLRWLYNHPVSEKELEPYFAELKRNNFEGWLKATGQDIEEVIEQASEIFFEANALVEQKEHENALALYDKAIKILPIFYEAIDNKGFVKMAQSNYNEAIDFFNASLEIEPENFNAVCAIGECYYEMNDIDTALIYFENAHHLEPDNELPLQFIQKIEAETEEEINQNTQPDFLVENAIKVANDSQKKQVEESRKEPKKWNWKFWQK